MARIGGVAALGSLLATFAAAPAHARDPAANFITHLFVDACIPNMGMPADTRTWAASKNLSEITDPAPLAIFVGPGGKGTAWAMSSSVGPFALSIRGNTQACAVWARRADTSDVETYFRALVKGVSRPGLAIQIVKDDSTPTVTGNARALVYRAVGPPGARQFLFTMLTAEHPGGAFQASMQVALVGTEGN